MHRVMQDNPGIKRVVWLDSAWMPKVAVGIDAAPVDSATLMRVLEDASARGASGGRAPVGVVELAGHGPGTMLLAGAPACNDEIHGAARAAYAQARVVWLASAKADDSENHTGEEEYNWFLAVLFPSDELAILPYNRVVKSLNGLTSEAFLVRLEALGRLERAKDPRPPRPGSFAFFLEGTWWLLTMDQASIDRSDPIGSLDVSLLQDRVLGPILGITDPRTDKRIDFVGGIRGAAELERRVTSGEMALGISMFPTSMDQLLAVSDAGEIMPPKSTWFEPKLRSGLFVHELS